MKKIELNDELELLIEMMPEGLKFTNDTEKYVCAYMCFFASDESNENGKFTMPITSLTNALKIHRNTASVAIASLVKKGYFEIVKKGSNFTHLGTTYQCLLESICALNINNNYNNNFSNNNNSTIVPIEVKKEKEENIIKEEKETTMTTDELEAIRIARTANFNRKNTTTNVVNENQTTKVVNNNFNFNFEDVATKVTGNNTSIKYSTFIQWLQERLEKLDAMARWQQSSYSNSIINFVNKWYPKVEDPEYSQETMLLVLKQHFNEMNGNMFTTEPSTSYGKKKMVQ